MKSAYALFCLFIMTLTVIPTATQAAIFFADDDNVTLSQPTQTSAFLAGETIMIDKVVRGDLFCAGFSVTINAPIEGDVLCAAKSLQINAPVGGNVRLVALSTLIDTRISQRATIFTSALTIGKNAILQNEWNVWAQTSDLVPGYLGANHLTINPFGDDPAEPRPDNRLPWLGLRYLTAIASALAVALMLGTVFPRRVPLSITGIRKQPVIALQFGIIATVTAPIASFLFILTIIGIPLGFGLLALWLALAYSAQVLTASILGHLLTQQWMKDRRRLTYLAPAVGIPLLWLLFFLPLVGWFVRIVAIVIGFAAIWVSTKNLIKSKSPQA